MDGIEIINTTPAVFSNSISVAQTSTINAAGYYSFGPLSITGGSTLNVTGATPYGVTVGETTIAGSPTFNLANPFGTLTLGPLNDGNSAQTITLTGGGTLTLGSAAASLVQGTVVNISSGTLNSNAAGTATSPGSLGSFAQVYVTGTLNIGASQTISALSGPSTTRTLTNIVTGGGTVSLGNNTLTIGNTDNITPAGSFAGVISDSGSGALVKSGNGTLTLTGPNTYAGGTTINAGVLAAGNNSALGTGQVTLAGGTLGIVPATTAGNCIGVHFGTNQNVLYFGDDRFGWRPGYAMNNWNNAPNASGNTTNLTGGVNTGANTGVLVDNTATASGAAVTWTSGGAPYASGQFATADQRLMGSFTNDGQTTVTFTNIPYANYEVLAYVGAEGANGRAATLAISGNPTYYFETYNVTNSDPYTYVPITDITSNSGNVYPSGNYAIGIGSGSSLTVTETSLNSNNGVMGIEIIDLAPVTTVSLANSISVSQSSAIALNGTSADSVGPLSIGGSTLSITGTSTGANAPYTLTTGAVTLSGSPTFNVANNGTGTGTLVLGALYDGGTARTITFTDTTDLSAPGAAVTLGSAATGLMPGTVVNVNGTVTLNSNNATALGSYANVSVASAATLNLGASQTVSAMNGAGTVNIAANTLTIGNTDNLSSTFSGSIRDGGAGGSLRVNTAGTVALNGTNAYRGTTTVSAGTLAVNAPAALGTTASVTVANNAALALSGTSGSQYTYNPPNTSLTGSGPSGGGALVSNSGANIYSSPISLGGSTTIASTSTASGDGLTLSGGISIGNNTLTFIGNGNVTVAGGPITDNGFGNVTYNGGGVLNLAVGNNYGGTTTVNSGTLRVSNSAGSATGNSTVNINAGTLAGNGAASIGGAVTIANGATIAPSGGGTATPGSVGTLTVGGLTLSSGAVSASTLNYQVTSSSSLDLIAATGGSGVLTLPAANNGTPATFNFYQPGTLTPYTFSPGVYELVSYLSVVNGGANISDLSIGTRSVPSGDTATFTTTNMAGQLDLVIGSTGAVSGTWISSTNSNSGTNFSNPSNWDSSPSFPQNPGDTATFGSGSAGTESLPISIGAPILSEF